MTSQTNPLQRLPELCCIIDPDGPRQRRLARLLGELGVNRVRRLADPLDCMTAPAVPTFIHTAAPDWGNQVRTLQERGASCIGIFPRGSSRIQAAKLSAEANLSGFLVAPVALTEVGFVLQRLEPARPSSGDAQVAALESRLDILGSRLAYQERHDTLTGLSNRRTLEREADACLAAAGEHMDRVALLHLDISGLKLVNTWEGYQTGDRLLGKIASVLDQYRAQAHVGRITSDEFGILLGDSSERQALETAEHLRHQISAMRFERNGNVYPIGASLGVALGRHDDAGDSRHLFTRAEQACYVAKRHGRNIVHLYSKDDLEILDQQLATHWVPRIRRALAEDRFKLVFQPVLRIDERRVDHYEVLIRMVDDAGNWMPPAEFIRVAENTGLIHDIDRWVVQEAIEVLRRVSQFNQRISLNINLSGRAFEDPLLVPMVRERLLQSNVSPTRITFEITETAAVSNFDKTREMVTHLRELGCRFALDDFGAGFNSYNYLKQFPVDFLKIDGSFITNLAQDPVDQALVKSMAEIAHTLGKQTVAEFVGNEETMQLLRDYRIDCAQGFYIGKPAPNIPMANLINETAEAALH